MFALIRLEVKKLLSQKRSLMGIFAIIILNGLFLLGFIIHQNRRGETASRFSEDYLVNEFMNANVFTFSILGPSIFLLFPMLIAIIASYMFASEFEIGSMRMVLMRPISRLNVLLSKFLVLSVYITTMLGVLGFLSYALASFFFEAGGLLPVVPRMYNLQGDLPSFMIYEGKEAVLKVVLAYVFSIPLLLSVSAMAMMFASITRHFTSSAILTTTLYFSSYIVGVIPFLSSIHPYLPTTKWSAWKYVLIEDIPWDTVTNHLLWTGAYTAVFLGIAYALFNMRDV